ncbi:MAG: response regulator transcription factor [Zoogloeaceae bacterium]|jgi:DNA-binding NarL/FixJ family response regulator|nr:response regulator transcription factor [Zoogloeaceae bacterium]
MANLLIIDDHALVREALVHVLQGVEGMRIEEAGSGTQALEILRNNSDFDLILLDLALPGLDGFACLKQFRHHYPHIAVVILSAFSYPETIERVFAEGASGFIPKHYSGDHLVRALTHVLDGGIFRPDENLEPSEKNEMPPAFPMERRKAKLEQFGLTGRQGEVFSLMVQGCSNREIAEKLGLVEGTVKIHLSAIFKRLGVSSRTQAIAMVDRRSIKR